MAKLFRFVLLATLACACVARAGAAPHAVKGNGVIEEQNRGTGHFDKVVLDIPYEVELEFVKADMVTVITDENLQDLIETKVRDGALHIALARPDTCLLASKLKIRMQAGRLGGFTLSGGGSFLVDGGLHISGGKAAAPPPPCTAG